MNLISADAWRGLFLATGFEELEYTPTGGKENLPARIHPRFLGQSPESLAASRLVIVHRKR